LESRKHSRHLVAAWVDNGNVIDNVAASKDSNNTINVDGSQIDHTGDAPPNLSARHIANRD